MARVYLAAGEDGGNDGVPRRQVRSSSVVGMLKLVVVEEEEEEVGNLLVFSSSTTFRWRFASVQDAIGVVVLNGSGESTNYFFDFSWLCEV